MAPYTVVFAPEAEEQIAELYRYIAGKGAPLNALRYTEAIVAYCEGLATVPHRGTRRDDIRPGLRITNYEGRAVIAFAVDDAAMRITIIGLYYGGRDYESMLS